MTIDNFIHLTLVAICCALAFWNFLTILDLHNCRERIKTLEKLDRSADLELRAIKLELRQAREHWSKEQGRLQAEIQQWEAATQKLETAELERSKAATTILEENDVLTTQREELLAHLREIQLRVNAALSPFEPPF